jgi:NAD(P)-dependent dehydrogenase (short-subunit alcohol dehydrogenase family)
MAEQIDWSKMLGAGYFRDRTVLITGASSGIGRDIAMSLSRRARKSPCWLGAKALLDELKGQVESAGAVALALGADVTRASEVRVAVDRTLETFGAIDILVNSAGVLIPGNVESMDPADLERMMGVNLYGTVHAMQAVLPSICAPDPGEISSTLLPWRGGAGYRRSAGTVRRNSRWSVSPKRSAWNSMATASQRR